MAKKKILIIEDEEVLLDVLSAKLKKEGYNISTAKDGEEGCERIQEVKPDMILLDIVMPKMDGYEVLEEMKRKNIKIPVIIISNSGQPVEIEKTKKLGAVDHLIKTEFEPKDVLYKIDHFLNHKNKEEKKGDMEGITFKKEGGDKEQNTKVLLVEDDKFLRELCSAKLVKEGFTVYEAIDGEDVLNNIDKIKPDIVLLDIILPAIDGFQVLSNIRNNKDKGIAQTPIIMLSNLGQKNDVEKAENLGATDYLIKAHFIPADIVKKIKQTLNLQE